MVKESHPCAKSPSHEGMWRYETRGLYLTLAPGGGKWLASRTPKNGCGYAGRHQSSHKWPVTSTEFSQHILMFRVYVILCDPHNFKTLLPICPPH
jgi:hypothetical protein